MSHNINFTYLKLTELSQASKVVRLCLGLRREEFSKRGPKGENLFHMPDLKTDARLSEPLYFSSDRIFGALLFLYF
jgi:hypothetical protein